METKKKPQDFIANVMYKTWDIGAVYPFHSYNSFLAGSVRDHIKHFLAVSIQDGVPQLCVLANVGVVRFDPAHRRADVGRLRRGEMVSA